MQPFFSLLVRIHIPTLFAVTFVAILCLCSLHIHAQTANIESFTIADGLSQGLIYDIEQTNDGFLWFATKDGLNRYDGYNFKVFINDPFQPYSIAGNDLFSLFEDSRGNLWIAVVGMGCDVLEKSSGRFLHLSIFKDIPGDLEVICFAESPDGTIWMGTTKGLFAIRWNADNPFDVLSPDLKSYTTVSLVSTGSREGKSIFTTVTATLDSSIIVSITDDGVYDFNPSSRVLSTIRDEDIKQRIRNLSANTPGKVLLAYNEHEEIMLLLSNSNMLEFPYMRGTPYNPAIIQHDGNGNMLWLAWTSTRDNVFSIPKKEAFSTSVLKNATIITSFDNESAATMELDRSGNLWVGMSGYGLRKIQLARYPFQHYLPGHSVYNILSTEVSNIWLATTTETWQLDEKTKKVRLVSGIPTGVQYYIQTKNGAAYMISNLSNHYYLRDPDQPLPPPLPINFPIHEYAPITEDKVGRIWIGGVNGHVMCFDPVTQVHTILNFSDSLGHSARVFSLHVDPYQVLWVGTTNGMAKVRIADFVVGSNAKQVYDLKKTIYQTNPENPSSLRYNFVTSICDDPTHPDQFLWVSTKGGGISLLEKSSNTFRHFTTQNSGLPNDVVYGMLPDDQGNLWMSTNRGLSRMTCPLSFYTSLDSITPSDRIYHGPVFKNFRASDGLQGDEFNTGAFYRHSDGRLMFGGVNGLTVFLPKEITDRTSDAGVRITNLRINNIDVEYFQKDSPLSKPVHLTEKIILRHNQNIVTLEFALMDFVTPEENTFRYMLHGVDPEWVNAGSNHIANYAQLRSGEYIFEVQGNIGYGNWSAPSKLSIIILPPWWASWWAYTIYFIIASVVLYSIVYFFKKRLLLKHELRLKFEEANRLKELDTFKSQLYTNLTHEFRTPLTVILGMTKQLTVGNWQSVVAEKEKGAMSNSLKMIESNGENLLQLINQLLDLSKLESKSFQLHLKQSDIVSYLRYVTESFQSFANGNNLSLRFFTTMEPLLMDFDPEQIKQVLTNLISNAIKFTPSGGDIMVKLLKTGNELEIQVSDTGIGIAGADLPFVFDRFYQADNSTTRIGQGTGIGLAHTQELVKLMDGTITMLSEPGKGTNVRVQLPIRNQATLTTPGSISIEPINLPGMINKAWMEETSYKDETQTTDSSLPQILIIEDNPDVVLYLRSCLDNDYQLSVAYNGKIGIEKALDNIPDVIISDVMMPEKDGYQVCDRLKNDERTSHIPIILLTAKADAASRVAGLSRGADAYLAKPFDLTELLVQISTLLENRKRMAAHFAKTIQTGTAPLLSDTAIIEDIKFEDVFVQKVNGLIAANYSDENFSLTQLCNLLAMSRSQLFRKMKSVTDTSPSDLIRTYRLQKAKALLESGLVSVAEATYQVGFKDPSYFSKMFMDEFGVQPSSLTK